MVSQHTLLWNKCWCQDMRWQETPPHTGTQLECVCVTLRLSRGCVKSLLNTEIDTRWTLARFLNHFQMTLWHGAGSRWLWNGRVRKPYSHNQYCGFQQCPVDRTAASASQESVPYHQQPQDRLGPWIHAVNANFWPNRNQDSGDVFPIFSCPVWVASVALASQSRLTGLDMVVWCYSKLVSRFSKSWHAFPFTTVVTRGCLSCRSLPVGSNQSVQYPQSC